MFSLCVSTLRRVAAEHGDNSGYAIARRTGIAESSVYRYLAGEAQPDLNSALLLARAYGITVEDLMQPTPQSVAA